MDFCKGAFCVMSALDTLGAFLYNSSMMYFRIACPGSRGAALCFAGVRLPGVIVGCRTLANNPMPGVVCPAGVVSVDIMPGPGAGSGVIYALCVLNIVDTINTFCYNAPCRRSLLGAGFIPVLKSKAPAIVGAFPLAA